MPKAQPKLVPTVCCFWCGDWRRLTFDHLVSKPIYTRFEAELREATYKRTKGVQACKDCNEKRGQITLCYQQKQIVTYKMIHQQLHWEYTLERWFRMRAKILLDVQLFRDLYQTRLKDPILSACLFELNELHCP